MRNILTIENAAYDLNEYNIFQGLSLSVKSGEWLSVAGLSGSGKTALAKLILGIYKGENHIYFSGEILNFESLSKIRKQIGVCFTEPSFKYQKVDTELAFPLKKLGYNTKKIRDYIFNMRKIFKLEKNRIESLTKIEKYKLSIARALIFEPKLLILDDILVNFDKREKQRVVKIINEIKEFNDMSVLVLTSDLEDTLFGDRTVVLKNGQIIMDDLAKNVIMEIDFLEKNGFKLPFMIDLSNKLKLYDLIDRVFVNGRELVNQLW